MSERCRSCGSVIPAEVRVIEDHLRAYKGTGDVWAWGGWRSWAQAVDEERYVEGVGRVVVVASQTSFSEEQGAIDRTAYVVFKIGDKYYRKSGSVDSYGDIEWNLAFNEVIPVKKEITVYDYS